MSLLFSNIFFAPKSPYTFISSSLIDIGNRTGFEPIFTPFPGYENLNSRGKVINPADNNGQSDAFVPKTNQYGFGDAVTFSDYTFTADDLPSFRYYRIKLLLVSSDQVYVPRVKDLRVMALA